MLKLILIAAVLNISSAAECQDSSRAGSREIIDPVKSDSFILKRKQKDILLSGAMRGKTNEGFALVEITVSPENEITDYKIMKLKLMMDSVTMIDFYFDLHRHTIRGKIDPIIFAAIKPRISNYVFNKINLHRTDSKKGNRNFEFLIRMK